MIEYTTLPPSPSGSPSLMARTEELPTFAAMKEKISIKHWETSPGGGGSVTKDVRVTIIPCFTCKDVPVGTFTCTWEIHFEEQVGDSDLLCTKLTVSAELGALKPPVSAAENAAANAAASQVELGEIVMHSCCQHTKAYCKVFLASLHEQLIGIKILRSEVLAHTHTHVQHSTPDRSSYVPPNVRPKRASKLG